MRTPALTATRVAVAGALAALDDGGARREAELAVAEARAFGAPRALGVALTAFGVLSDDSDALTEGVDVLGRSEARLDHAHALVALGAALRRRGRRTDASARLQEGLRIARVCGATPLAATAHEELASSGMHPRKILRAGADALTPGELRVATLAAQGRTNQEIARALTLSPRTIETHLARTYQKLDIGSRRQLGAALGL